MESISALQNKEESIHKLAAIREAYSCSKIGSRLNFWFSVVGAILVSVLTILLDNQEFTAKFGFHSVDISILASLYGFGITAINVFFLSKCIKEWRELGALIQESFDIYVYSIPWNPVLVGEEPAPEDIYGLYEKQAKKTDLSKLKDWYPVNDLNLAGDPVSICLCQRTNLKWDKDLRKISLHLSNLFLFSVLAIFILLGAYFHESSTEFLIGFAIPMLPFFVFASKLVISNSETILHINFIRNHVENLVKKIQQEELDHQLALITIRQIQDVIYIHRRDSGPVSDWLYWKTRDNQEKKAKYAATSKG